jgi:hypothetical protein
MKRSPSALLSRSNILRIHSAAALDARSQWNRHPERLEFETGKISSVLKVSISPARSESSSTAVITSPQAKSRMI